VAIDRLRSIAAILRAGSWQHDIVMVGGQWTAKCQRRLIQAKGKKCVSKSVWIPIDIARVLSIVC